MQFNKDKFRKLINRYNMNNFCKEFNINRETIARLASPSKNAREMTVSTAYKLAKGMNLSLDAFINAVYDVENVENLI